jgi:serine/threonine-protein kinase
VRGRGYAESSDRDVVETGRRLGVDVVVDGSVRRAGDMLRVSARLVGVADGFQIWSSRFERPAGGSFALNDDVARAIAAALAAESSGAPRAQPSDPGAIDVYFRAKHAVGRFWSTQGQTEVRALFEEAVARAPDDPTILAGYVHVQIGRNFFRALDPAETASLVRRALVAGQRLPEPWIALAAARFNHKDDPVGAIRAVKRALDLGPSSSDAHDLAGRILLEADLMEEAVAHSERALWLDPRQRWARVDLLRAAALGGDWAKAREVFDEGKDPEWLGYRLVHASRLWSWPGAPEVETQPVPDDADPRFASIIRAFLRARECRRTGETLPLSEIRERMGDVIGRVAPQSRARRFYTQMMAEQAAIAGHREAVIDFIEAAVADGLLDIAWMRRLRLFDPIRANPRFEGLTQRVRERAERVVVAWRGPPESLDDALTSLQ